MYVYSAHSGKKIFHNEQCACVQKISPENIKLAHTRDELVAKGYAECKFCGVLAKQYRKEKKAIDNWCQADSQPWFQNR